MAKFIRTLAGDLLNLEVSTIIKENSSSAKMPTKRRVALLQIADKYRAYLHEHGLASLDSPIRKNFFRWRFGGEYSFVEILIFASASYQDLESWEESAKSPSDRSKLEKIRLMVDRIVSQSSNIVGMFKMRRKDYEAEIIANTDSIYYAEKLDYTQFKDDSLFPSQKESVGWNNDVDLKDINDVGDIDLTPEHITLIRKIWEIGMEQVLLQTMIQIDGDITSTLSKDFLRMPERTKDMVMSVHNDSIKSSTHIWKMLFETIVNIAGKGFNKIFEKSNKA
jgi:hypothetical protein